MSLERVARQASDLRSNSVPHHEYGYHAHTETVANMLDLQMMLLDGLGDITNSPNLL